MITSANQLVFSKAAIARIFGLVYRSMSQIHFQVWFKVVWVWIEGHRPRFVSKQVFLKHFADWRKQAAKALKVTRHLMDESRLTVRNEVKDSFYTVELRAAGVFCHCEDFNNQLDFWGKGCCKHGYAVLGHLGFDSLESYIQQQQWQARREQIPSRPKADQFEGISIS